MLTRHRLTCILASLLFLSAAPLETLSIEGSIQATEETQESETKPMTVRSEVVVMGMIHRNHKRRGPYDIEHLKTMIRAIGPDYVLTEIPPDRLDAANAEFAETGAITEERVSVFPEYTDALYPLTKEMDFEIVGCAGWTKEMAASRSAKLAELKDSHAEQYTEMVAAQRELTRRLAQLGSSQDPVLIHTDQYDAIVEEGMSPYDRHFNDAIGDGGWSNINAAHYGHIADALDAHKGEGKRFLVTFGAWHKNYIRKELKKRDDVVLIPMSQFIEESHPSPTTWTQFRGNGYRNGSYGSTEIESPKVRWEFDTEAIIESSASVVGDTVLIGGHSKKLHAFDRETGELRWVFEAGGLIRSSPTVDDEIVYFGADDNIFYALELMNGDLHWKIPLGEGGQQSTAVLTDGTLYFGAFDNHLYSVDATTTEVLWKHNLGAAMLSSPAVSKRSVFIGTFGGLLAALDLDSGRVKWSAQVSEEPILSSPLVAEGFVYFTSYDKHIYAADESTGEIAWKFATDGAIFSSPASSGDTIYFGSNDEYLYALDAESGALQWKTNLGGAVFSSPAVTGQSIYVGSSDGNMYALNRADGSIRWKHSVGEDVNVWTSPAAVQGRLYFGSHAGKIVVLEENDG